MRKRVLFLKKLRFLYFHFRESRLVLLLNWLPLRLTGRCKFASEANLARASDSNSSSSLFFQSLKTWPRRKRWRRRRERRRRRKRRSRRRGRRKRSRRRGRRRRRKRRSKRRRIRRWRRRGRRRRKKRRKRRRRRRGRRRRRRKRRRGRSRRQSVLSLTTLPPHFVFSSSKNGLAKKKSLQSLN